MPTDRLDLRLSADDKARILARAKAAGVSLSEFVRRRCLGDDGPEPVPAAAPAAAPLPPTVRPAPPETPGGKACRACRLRGRPFSRTCADCRDANA